MDLLAELSGWIAGNEALLSGAVSLIVLASLVLSPLGRGLRRLLTRARERSSPSPDGSSTQPHPPNTAAPVEPLLAVLAFDNLSSDDEMGFFSDGVSDEIIQRLSRGARLKVIGRTSSFQFRGARKAEASAGLNCTHLLDGSIRRSTDRVRISAHLVEVASQTTMWSEKFDCELEDSLEVQDRIAAEIAAAMNRTFSRFSTLSVDPAAYDLYLKAHPESYAPAELGASIDLLEQATARAPDFAEAWGRLAFLRAWLHFYLPFSERPMIAARVRAEADRAEDLDPENVYAMAARLFTVPPFGRFVEGGEVVERLKRAAGADAIRGYIGWYLRTTGQVRQSLEEAEKAFRLDALDPMTGNLLALARMAAGRLDDAVPVFEDLVERVPDMSFPVSSLMRAYSFQKNWDGVDRLLNLAAERELREFEDGLPFIRAKRNPSDDNVRAWRDAFTDEVGRTGCVDVSSLVYAAHLGLVDEAYEAADGAWLGPRGAQDDVLGPDGYRTSLLFQADMPELRNDRRFPGLCARLGLVDYWTMTGRWPDCAGEVPYDFRAECERHRNVAKDVFWPPPPGCRANS